MGMPVNLVADSGVEQEHIVAVCASAYQLSEAIGLPTDPELRVQRIGDRVLRMNSRGQIDESVINDLAPLRNGGLTFVVVSKDLGVPDSYPRQLNFLFGVSNKNTGNVILSTHRMQTVEDVQALALHESGHSVGLVSETARNYDRLSSFAGHCVNDCVMVPGNSYADMVKMRSRIEQPHPFCGDCTGFLSRMRIVGQ